jgi:LruC domain-containing protein
MKRMIPILFEVMILFASCTNNKDLYDSNSTDDQSTASLTSIPSNFSWKTLQRVSVNITSPVSSSLAIYSDKACTNLLANVPVTKNEKVSFNVNIPTALNELYVEYPTGKCTKKISTVAISSASTKADNSGNGGSADITGANLSGIYEAATVEEDFTTMSVTNKGTVMFEDSWPALADYDMNDVVLDFTTKGYIYNDMFFAGAYQYTKIEVTLTIRAIGGVFPDKIGFTFANNTTYSARKSLLTENDIDKYEGLDVEQNGLKVTLANPNAGSDSPIFYVSSLRDIATKGFYNTKQHDGDSKSVTFTIDMKSTTANTDGISNSYDAGYQDFFIVNKNGREIHLRGFNATSLYSAYNSDKSMNKKLSSTPYCTSDNHIWGIMIPQGYSYPKEKVDIKDAFSGFTNWITSGGNSDDDWYEKPVADKTLN